LCFFKIIIITVKAIQLEMTYMWEFGETPNFGGATHQNKYFPFVMGIFDWPIKKTINQALGSPKLDSSVVISSFGQVIKVTRAKL
jgi:hypothetical protein